MGIGCVSLAASSSCYDVWLMHSLESTGGGWNKWGPGNLNSSMLVKFFLPLFEKWCRLLNVSILQGVSQHSTKEPSMHSKDLMRFCVCTQELGKNWFCFNKVRSSQARGGGMKDKEKMYGEIHTRGWSTCCSLWHFFRHHAPRGPRVEAKSCRLSPLALLIKGPNC